MTDSNILPYLLSHHDQRLDPAEELRLSTAYHHLRASYEDAGRPVGQAVLFNGAYGGLQFRLEGVRVRIREDRGSVGLEDHSPGGIAVNVEGNPETRWVVRHASRTFGDVVPTEAEWAEGYARVETAIDELLKTAQSYAATRAVRGQSVAVREVSVSRPMNSRGGLYVHLLGHHDDLVGPVGEDTASRLAAEAGWNPDGRTSHGPPCRQDGLYTRSFWFHDRCPTPPLTNSSLLREDPAP